MATPGFGFGLGPPQLMDENPTLSSPGNTSFSSTNSRIPPSTVPPGFNLNFMFGSGFGSPGAGTSGGLMTRDTGKIPGYMPPPPIQGINDNNPFGSPGAGTSGGLMTGGVNPAMAERQRQMAMMQQLPGWAGYLQWLQLMGRR